MVSRLSIAQKQHNPSSHPVAARHKAERDCSVDISENRVYDSFVSLQAEFELENDVSLVFPLTEKILEMVASTYGPYDDFFRMKLAISLEEAVTNAIIHGNLEIPSSLRDGRESDYRRLMEQRPELLPFSSRRTSVAVILQRHQMSFVVRDQGPGFQVNLIPDPTAKENLEKVSGRGLALMRSFMDLVIYNLHGNVVTMIKSAPVR